MPLLQSAPEPLVGQLASEAQCHCENHQGFKTEPVTFQ